MRRATVTVSGRGISFSGICGGVGEDGERVCFRELVRDGGCDDSGEARGLEVI